MNEFTQPPFCNHKSCGVIVERYGTLLLIERQKFPIGMACPAGHVEEGETYEQAAYRELFEETGLEAHSLELVAQGRRYQACRRPSGLVHFHDWKVYRAQVTLSQQLRENTDECKSADWYTPQHLAYLAKRTELYQAEQLSPLEWQADPGLEVVWYNWLRHLKLI
jgi:ADP-ribose pyrophosphatase YjhB (NUDIX family)